MKKAKMNYKLYLRQCRKDENSMLTDKLYSTLTQHDSKSVWKIWKKKFCTNVNSSCCVDGNLTNTDITNNFKVVFEKVCSPNSQSFHDKYQREFIDLFNRYAYDDFDHMLNIEDIEFAVNSVKLGKSPGFDLLMVEHLIHAHPVLFLCLKYLFSMMLYCGYVPNAFGCGILIPLLKSTDCDANLSSNYRGLTLSPVLSKIFEYILLSKFGASLNTSDLPFGFKSNIGCSDALFCVNTVVNYYRKHGNTINIETLDVSKAFDKV